MKIIVIGCPGAGKSTFSKKLKDKLKVPLFHLDMLFHNADGTHISTEELEEKVQKIFDENEEWIIDGNYQRTLETRFKECDTVYFLDYPLEVCLAGAESRVGKKRDDIPWVEEKLNDEFRQVILNFPKEKLPHIYELIEKYKKDKKIIILKSRDEAEKYLLKLINPQLRQYIQKLIEYHYNNNDNGHGISHAEYVIKRSMEFAEQIENINFEMVYVIAAYHDVAHHIDAKNHESISAKMLSEDENLKAFFTDEQIKIMSEAVEDHRSSLETEPRSLYGKIVSSADRNTSVEATLVRCYSYNKKHFPDLNEDDIIEQCRNFLLKKYGLNGYARDKMYFDDKQYIQYLEDITELASNKEGFIEEIKRVNELIK